VLGASTSVGERFRNDLRIILVDHVANAVLSHDVYRMSIGF